MSDNDARPDTSADGPVDAFTDVSVAGVLQDMVLESTDVEEFLTNLAKLAAGRFSSPDTEVLAAVTLLRPRTKTTVASSNDHAKKMDEIQYAFDDGPCLRAAREVQTHTVADFRTETRFGRYPAAIADHGILSAIGVPIPLDGDANAAMNLYALGADHFTAEDIADAEMLACQAAKSLRTAVRIAKATDTNDHLKAAMDTRTLIDVAAGIIMGQNRCSHDTAMTILKAASSGRNMKLNAVAAVVVQSIGQDLPNTHFDT
ncbi:ANTAR domain-containing protein [Arthrobacter cheniae]|uniref:ANTAR domain-containing protein n=1 Tax=Arthrobacter cheniae TaxID=1258888 RepID=A0A3A5MBC0_9MICC|nr:GAF and ANTAR domain-containing protein [Arthrobacter cheniae]RJT82909.1 ANTAR domain-containing protein [Arthrobacter cheniae]